MILKDLEVLDQKYNYSIWTSEALSRWIFDQPSLGLFGNPKYVLGS